MKDDLDRQLQAWWGERREGHDIEGLKRRISEAAKTAPDDALIELDRQPVPGRGRKFGIGLAAALCLLLALLLGRWTAGTGEGINESGFLAMAQIPVRELEAGARVFDETSQLFDRRLKWIAETDGDVAMGIESGAGVYISENEPSYVRVLVLQRKEGETGWQQSWKADVIVRDEEVALVDANAPGQEKITLWVYPVDEGRFMVDTQMAFGESKEYHSKIGALLEDGQPKEVARTQLGDTEYRIWQTVARINATEYEG